MTISVLIPTRNRAAYLDRALASLRRQFDGEVVIVVDGPAEPDTEAVAARHGALTVTLGEHRGINVARNAAVDAAGGDVLAFLDDDVELWPTWRAALERAVARHPGTGCFGGPIRPVLHGPAPRGCGRPQDAPITALDLGPADGPLRFAWGANFAVRREALEWIGPFDPALNFSGDEEEWQRRLHTAGGEIRYVARAGVDHVRRGDDARLRALALSAYHRGRAARRDDERKGTAPALARELRVLGGTLFHVAAKRCPAGLVPVARSAGRVRAAAAR